MTFALAPGSWDEAERTLDVVLYTGAVVKRRSWEMGGYLMRLDMSPGAADLGRLNNGAPFLLQHGNDGFLGGGAEGAAAAVTCLLGTFVDGSCRIDGGQLVGRVHFLDRDLAEASGVEPVIQGIVRGFRRNVSFGFDIGEMILEKADPEGMDQYLVTKWSAFEGSSVLMGADDDAGYMAMQQLAIDAKTAAQRCDAAAAICDIAALACDTAGNPGCAASCRACAASCRACAAACRNGADPATLAACCQACGSACESCAALCTAPCAAACVDCCRACADCCAICADLCGDTPEAAICTGCATACAAAMGRCQAMMPAAGGAGAMSLTAPQRRELRAELDKRQETATMPDLIPVTDSEREQVRAQAEQLAAARTKKVLTSARALGFDPARPEVLALLEEQVETAGGSKRYLSADEASTRLIDLRAKEADAIPTSGAHRGAVVLGAEDCEKRGEGIANALLHRAQPNVHKLTDAGRRYAGLRLGEICREVVAERYGAERVRVLNAIQVSELALHMRSERLGGLLHGEHFALSTSDFPLILADVAHKSLRAGYEAAPRTFLEWCTRGTAPDYRAQNEPILDGASAIQPVTQNGTYQEGTVREGSESWRVTRSGILIRLTPEMLANDDLDAFTLVPMRIGDSAAVRETSVVYGILTANAALVEDTVALFHATHGNLIAGGGGLGAPSGTSMAAMRALARLMTNRQSQLLNIDLPHVILPSAHEGIVEQLTDIVAFRPTTAANAPTEYLRTRMFHVEPVLDATSTTQWYMAANPTRVSTIKYGWLQGQEGVQISQEVEFASSALVLKGEHHFGAGAMDHRGLYRNNGA